MSLHRQRLLAGVTLVLIVSVLGGAAVYAAIPNGQGTFTGCYLTSGSPLGRLRVIDPSAGQTCTASEAQSTWAQRWINWRGTWNAATQYRKNDAVGEAGTSYVAKVDNVDVQPPNSGTWAVLAKKGNTGAPGAPGATGPAGPAGPKGFGQTVVTFSNAPDQHFHVTPVFTAAANATCVVTSSVQVYATTAEPTDLVFVRNSILRNGVASNDGTYGHYVVTNGAVGRQPSMTRSSLFSIGAGETIRFGAYFGDAGQFENSTAHVNTTYLCS